MHEWVVGGAIIEGPGGVLLVQNRRRNGAVDWSPPGGVIDAGESVLEGLSREVTEETGLVVTEWEGPVYEVRAEAPGLGWRLRAEIHLATAFEGALLIEDPDGVVVDAVFVPPEECGRRLRAGHPWVREPLSEWLSERWRQPRAFGYLVEGEDVGSLTVHRR